MIRPNARHIFVRGPPWESIHRRTVNEWNQSICERNSSGELLPDVPGKRRKCHATDSRSAELD